MGTGRGAGAVAVDAPEPPVLMDTALIGLALFAVCVALAVIHPAP